MPSLDEPAWRRLRAAAGLACAALVVGVAAAGCSGGESPGAAEAAEAADDPTSTPSVRLAAPSIPHPRTGDCHDLTVNQTARARDPKSPIPCDTKHTTQTFYVGTFEPTVIGDLTAPDTTAIANDVTPRCEREFARWVGGDAQTRVLSRLHVAWFVPSDRDIRLGARWFRCDVVASATDDRLAELPRRTRGLLNPSGALDTYGSCSRGSPEERGSTSVMCDRSHTWQAFAALRLDSGKTKAYPGSSVRQDARARCRTQARQELDFPLEWRYGWQPPTRSQWDSGLRHGICWVPRG